MQPVRGLDGARVLDAPDRRRKRRLVVALWIGAAMLAIVGALFFISPYELYQSVVGRLVETGFIEPRLAHFLAPLPAIAFMYCVGDLLWALVFGRRFRAIVAAALIAFLGVTDAALFRNDPKELINPITGRGNYRWYRDAPTADDPAGRIILVAPWWRTSGLGHPAHDLDGAVADEYTLQQERVRKRQASFAEQQKAIDAETKKLAERTKELDALIERLKVAEAARATLAASPDPVGIGTVVVAPPAERASTEIVEVPSEPREIPVGQTQPVPVGDGQYLLTVRSCRKVGSSFYLYVQYRNQTAEDLDLILDGRETELFDDTGNQYTPASARFSGDRREAEVPAGLITNAVFRFDNLAAEARTAPVLRIGTRWSSNSHRRSMISTGQRSSGEFRDVPLGSRLQP